MRGQSSYNIGKGEARFPWANLVLIVSAVFTFLSLPSFGLGQNPAITEVVVTNHEGNKVVYARATDLFSEEMDSVILSGMPVHLVFTLDLFQERRFWFDKRIARLVVRHSLKYDAVKKIFQVMVSDDREPEGFSDLLSAKRVMSELNGVAMIALGKLNKERNYHFRLKAKLERVRHPIVIKYLSYLMPWLGVETNWHRQRLLDYGR